VIEEEKGIEEERKMEGGTEKDLYQLYNGSERGACFEA